MVALVLARIAVRSFMECKERFGLECLLTVPALIRTNENTTSSHVSAQTGAPHKRLLTVHTIVPLTISMLVHVRFKSDFVIKTDTTNLAA